MRLHFFLVKLNCQSSTIILSVDNKYSRRDLFYYANYRPQAMKLQYASNKVHDVRAPSSTSKH